MEETQQQQGLRRSLKARHMNMIAIGGAIGTGLFVAGGETVSSAGPATNRHGQSISAATTQL